MKEKEKTKKVTNEEKDLGLMPRKTFLGRVLFTRASVSNLFHCLENEHDSVRVESQYRDVCSLN